MRYPQRNMFSSVKHWCNVVLFVSLEPNNLGQYGTPITAEQDAKDFLTLRKILDDAPELGKMLIGPDVDRIWEQPKAREYLNQ